MSIFMKMGVQKCGICMSSTVLYVCKMLSKIKLKHIIIATLLLITFYITGLLSYLYASDANTFTYHYEGDVLKLVIQLRNNEKPSLEPMYVYPYSFITDCNTKCKNVDLRLVYLVKSAPEHFKRRRAIRHTWGYEKRFSDVEIRTIFLLGRRDDPTLQEQVHEEYLQFGDIVQMNFHDSYFNNTAKTIMGFKWAITFCPNSKFYFFVDDDMYVSTKNLLRFVRHPTKYPEYLINLSHGMNNVLLKRPKRQIEDFELPEGIRLYAGYVKHAAPMRFIFSKWYVSLEEYPWNSYPLYATAGCYVLSKAALFDMYYTSLYTKHFRFDDVYLGIVAKKADIEPYHSEHFHLFKEPYDRIGYTYLIASHGYDNPEELIKVWTEQKDLGHA